MVKVDVGSLDMKKVMTVITAFTMKKLVCILKITTKMPIKETDT